MKKLLLFCLLASVPAFGQAYSSSVTQNSPGNYGRPVPYATVLVCGVTDTAVPCTTKVPTFTTQTLTTQCSSNAGSGVLTGAPTSGTNCNNPGIADINGNFTIYVAPGQYMICTYANNWLCQPQSIASGPTTTFNCVGALNGSIMATINPTTASCDPNMGTDFAGNGFAQSWKYLGPVNGFFGVIGGAPDPGTVPAYKLNTNEVRALAPLTVPTPYYWRWPGTRCTTGQVWQMTGETTDANGDKVDTYGCLTPGSGVTFQTNTVNNASQTLLNLVAGANVTLTNTSGGNVTIAAAGSAPPTMATPTAPTVTPTGVTGATAYSYKVVICEDGPTCNNHTAASLAGSTSTGNATLTTSNYNLLTAYVDSYSGQLGRCMNIYRTAGGATQGLIGNCVWKQFKDTGLTGDGTTAPTTNTTTLDATGLTAPLPGCNKIWASPWGIDSLPCTGNAYDDEFTWGNGTWAPGDTNNPGWTWVNQGSATATLTNGTLNFTADTAASTNVRMLVQPLPGSTPYTFVTYVDALTLVANGGCGFGFRESSTGKFTLLHMYVNNTQDNIVSPQMYISAQNYTSPTSGSSIHQMSYVSAAYYLKMQNDGANIKFSYSLNGVNYIQLASETIASGFTTAPNQLLLAADSSSTVAPVCSFDYLRRTQ